MAKRRAHGEGTIVKRSDGRFQAALDLGTINGKRRRRYVYGKTKKEVADKLQQLKQEQRMGISLEPSRERMDDYLEYWLEHVAKRKVRPRVWALYAQVVRTHHTPIIGNLILTSITDVHIDRLLLEKAQNGLSHNTLRNIRTVLSSALTYAVKRGSIIRNPARLVSIPPTIDRQRTNLTDDDEDHLSVHALDLDEANRLFAAVAGDRLEALYWTTLLLGLRRGEVLGLRLQDVHLAPGDEYIRITGSISRYGGALHRDAPKTKSSRRTIPIPTILANKLREHLARRISEATSPNWVESGYFFTSSGGTSIDPRNLHRRFKNALRQAHLPDIRFHDLRHSCASLLRVYAPHLDARDIMAILGHSAIDTTLDIYTHLFPEHQRTQLQVWEDIFQKEEEQPKIIRYDRYDQNGQWQDGATLTTLTEITQVARYSPSTWRLIVTVTTADGEASTREYVCGSV
jgi:integrase